jgi:hypothetical protein
MYRSSHKNRETPGNFTLLLRDVRDPENTEKVMDINLVQGKLNELFFINNNINQSEGGGGFDIT